MGNSIFKFKEFSIQQEKSAMKVGTDGVLLGAWVSVNQPKRILDIGTGTGLIALMLAQRFPEAEITGIEPDEAAFSEAKFNVDESKFHKRITILNKRIQTFQSQEKFDLILSNPPFFERTHQENSSRNKARQQHDLTFAELISNAASLLLPDGHFAVIIPFQSENSFLELAAFHHLYPKKITHIRGNETAPFKRTLLLLSFTKFRVEPDLLTLEIARNVYTQDYINLTRDFYLKM